MKQAMSCQFSFLSEVALFLMAALGFAVLALAAIALYWKLFDAMLKVFRVKRLFFDFVFDQSRKRS